MDRSKLGAAMDSKKLKPRNIRETKVWRDTAGAVQQMWSNYVNLLKGNFQTMSREEQCKLITRLCQIITTGVAGLAAQFFFYYYLPLFVKVIALPAYLIGAWMIGTRVVSKVIIKRVDKHLNQW
jgi:hypothetical protein